MPDVKGDKPKLQKFKRYPIGFFHVDIAEVQTAEGKRCHYDDHAQLRTRLADVLLRRGQ